MCENKRFCEISNAEEIKELKRQIMNLEAQLAIQTDRANRNRGGNLLKSEAIDFYPGEQLDFVLSVLQQAQKKCDPDSRSYDILESILSQNQPVGRGTEILGELERIFKKGLPTSADVAKLEDMGFTYTQSRKHPKLRFHERYMFVIPNTPSDHRGCKNALAQIHKCIAVSQKV